MDNFQDQPKGVAFPFNETVANQIDSYIMDRIYDLAWSAYFYVFEWLGSAFTGNNYGRSHSNAATAIATGTVTIVPLGVNDLASGMTWDGTNNLFAVCSRFIF